MARKTAKRYRATLRRKSARGKGVIRKTTYTRATSRAQAKRFVQYRNRGFRVTSVVRD